MIRWTELKSYGVVMPDTERRRWIRTMCRNAYKHDGLCDGYADGNDDEPCEICKVCDKLGIDI